MTPTKRLYRTLRGKLRRRRAVGPPFAPIFLANLIGWDCVTKRPDRPLPLWGLIWILRLQSPRDPRIGPARATGLNGRNEKRTFSLPRFYFASLVEARIALCIFLAWGRFFVAVAF